MAEKKTTGRKAAVKKTDAPAQDVNEALLAKIAELEARLAEAEKRPAAPEQERVWLLWQAEVADDNVITFGENGRYGRIVGKTGSFRVPKDAFDQILDDRTRLLLEQRWLMVMSGMTDEEREIYGVKYREGELLDRQAFANILDLGDDLVEMYPALCREHQKMIAQRFGDAFRDGDPRVDRGLVEKLNDLSKEAGSREGDFVDILRAMYSAVTETDE